MKDTLQKVLLALLIAVSALALYIVYQSYQAAKSAGQSITNFPGLLLAALLMAAKYLLSNVTALGGTSTAPTLAQVLADTSLTANYSASVNLPVTANATGAFTDPTSPANQTTAATPAGDALLDQIIAQAQ